MLDHLAGDDEVGRLEPERRYRLRRLRVDDVRLEALAPRPRDALRVRVEADERGRRVREPRVEPDALRELRGRELVDEPDVDDAPPLRRLEEGGVPVDRPAPRQAVAPADPLLPLRPER